MLPTWKNKGIQRQCKDFNEEQDADFVKMKVIASERDNPSR
jgi:hypothetical protein